jgi:thiol:disulfide interchange protein DsbC
MIKPLVAFTLLAFAHSAFSADAVSDSSVQEAQFASRVHERFPGIGTAAIAPAFPGFHYIAKDGEVLFVRDDLSVLISGNVIDLASNKSLVSDIKARNPRRVDLSKLNLNDAIRFGHGKKRLYVFSDPDCPYCRTLQPEVDKLRDVEVFIFPFPLTGLHPGARDVAASIWCQPDRASAWDDYVVRHVAPKATPSCANPLERNAALATSIGIRATPTMVLPDGSLIEGGEQADRIEARVAEASK